MNKNLIQELAELEKIKNCKHRKQKLRSITDSVEYGYKMTEHELDALFNVIRKYSKPERGTWIREDYQTAVFTRHRRFPSVTSIELITHDNDAVEISNGTIVGEKEATETERLNKALRYSILDQIITFKQTIQKTICPITGMQIIDTKAEVDHIIPFCNLRDTFLSTLDSKPETRLCEHTKNWLLCDAVIDEKWKEFHALNAKLRWISTEGNQKYAQHCRTMSSPK